MKRIRVITKDKNRTHRYHSYLKDKRQYFPVQMFLYGGLKLPDSGKIDYSTLSDDDVMAVKSAREVLDFNPHNICAHTGLNGGFYNNQVHRPDYMTSGRYHNSERIMFGSYNPKHEVFLEPCSLKRVKYVCKKGGLRLADDYRLKKDGKIIFCLNNNIGWYKDKFSLNDIDKVKASVDKIREYTDRKIEIRLHPKDRERKKRADIADRNEQILKDYKLKLCREDHWACMEKASIIVVDHTTMVVEAAVRGIPVFYTGKTPKDCVGNDYFMKGYELFDLNNFKKQNLPDRESFLRKYFSSILTLKELQGGVELPNLIDKYIAKYITHE